MAWVQFTAFIRVTLSEENDSRIENIRDLQYASYSIQQALVEEATINLALPSTTSYLGDFNSIGQYVPAIGDDPALVKITGFHDYDVSGPLHPSNTIIHANEVVTGSGISHLCDSNPSSSYYDGVMALKDIINNAVPDHLAEDYEFEIYRINYAGVVWGNRGLTL